MNKAERLAYWEGIISEWKLSGKSQSSFCREKGLSPRKFYYWHIERFKRDKLKKTKCNSKLYKISVPLEQNKEKADPIDIEVHLPKGIKLNIKNKTDISKAANFIKLLVGEL